MGSRLRFWDVALVVALALMVAGMFLPWWGFNPAELWESLGLPRGDTGLFGLATEYRGWEAPLRGLGLAAIILDVVAIAFAASKYFLPSRAPLPDWHKEGWVVGLLGGVCTLLGIVVCVTPPAGGLAAWGWHPGSVLVLGGGVVMSIAGVVMTRDQVGRYQIPVRLEGKTSTPATPQPVPERAACLSCGVVLPSDAAFCIACGRRV